VIARRCRAHPTFTHPLTLDRLIGGITAVQRPRPRHVRHGGHRCRDDGEFLQRTAAAKRLWNARRHRYRGHRYRGEVTRASKKHTATATFRLLVAEGHWSPVNLEQPAERPSQDSVCTSTSLPKAHHQGEARPAFDRRCSVRYSVSPCTLRTLLGGCNGMSNYINNLTLGTIVAISTFRLTPATAGRG
jgi:hypothetical protein